MSKGPWKKKQLTALNGLTDKPKLPHLDPLEAALETARCAQEGNRKLAISVDLMRKALEIIATAEMDHSTGTPIGVADLRQIALEALDGYSALTGQNWKLARNKVVDTRAGGKGNKVTPENMAFG